MNSYGKNRALKTIALIVVSLLLVGAIAATIIVLTKKNAGKGYIQDGMLMQPEATIRLGDPTGVRFSVNIEPELYREVEGNENKMFGIMIAPLSYYLKVDTGNSLEERDWINDFKKVNQVYIDLEDIHPYAVTNPDGTQIKREENAARRRFREDLREGRLDEKVVEADVPARVPAFNMIAPEGMDDLENQLQGVFDKINARQREKRRLPIKEVLEIYTDEEAGRLIDEDDITRQAIDNVENNGIVFIDEIDKIARGGETNGADVSREGVQRDLLPLIEGTSVKTKYGWVRTDHVLFICSGAFHLSKPSDLVPELQGRLPIRVELKSLTCEDFERILTATDASIVKQYEALLGADGAQVAFTEDAIKAIARYAYEVNERTENIGARRLHTVMEKLLEEVSFEAGNRSSMQVQIDENYVNEHLGAIAGNEDLSRYVL